MSTPALEELKIRARIARNAARRDAAPSLRDCLHGAARDVGFQHWEHARQVLGGLARAGDDLGGFWHAPGCSALLNQWFANPLAARAALAGEGGFLLPYRRQFVLVQSEFIRELGLDPARPEWAALQHDVVSGYGSAAWAALCFERLRSPEARFG